MSGLVEVIDGGIGNSIQDAGRFGFRHMGIAVSGCLDLLLARCANALVGNAPDSACIEIRAVGPALEIKHGRVRMALAGNLCATLMRGDGRSRQLLPWMSLTLFPKDRLEIDTLTGGTAYLAVTGGIRSPLQLGSRSTYQRAMIGGIDGRQLATGQLLPCATQEHRQYHESQSVPWAYADGPIRVMPGPQEECFKPESMQTFLRAEYRVSAQQDRMGMRLQGPSLVHVTPQAADIVSDGVTPGAIQVPGNGQPIILLADCQTVGGYPKIATVISADLPRLAQLQPEQMLRFCAVNAAQAKAALRAREAQWETWVSGIAFGLANVSALYNDPTAGWDCAGE
ncbi:biotin-dependent carboxyltransferase family protein [Propionivibrio sp.]|uniref:5-oxoprolinase subunit C family protein n=1 Tax=Propionivibrio sp. TaxID=2212460 RepID=UPI0026247BF3|nr:biotin-dependent carboxyltransferase family protein [Propionivibrio sp.]